MIRLPAIRASSPPIVSDTGTRISVDNPPDRQISFSIPKNAHSGRAVRQALGPLATGFLAPACEGSNPEVMVLGAMALFVGVFLYLDLIVRPKEGKARQASLRGIAHLRAQAPSLACSEFELAVALQPLAWLDRPVNLESKIEYGVLLAHSLILCSQPGRAVDVLLKIKLEMERLPKRYVQTYAWLECFILFASNLQSPPKEAIQTLARHISRTTRSHHRTVFECFEDWLDEIWPSTKDPGSDSLPLRFDETVFGPLVEIIRTA